MKVVKTLVAAAFGAALLAGCQPAAPPAEEPLPSVEAAAPAVELPCGVLAQRDWQAELSSGSSRTLTVSGVVDLATPGFGVSLARDSAEAAGATTALLTLALRPPTDIPAQVVTPHPVRYFGPAASAYTDVQISCDGAPLVTFAIGG